MERTGSSVRVFKAGREKEVVEIMNILFDQEYAMERRDDEQGDCHQRQIGNREDERKVHGAGYKGDNAVINHVQTGSHHTEQLHRSDDRGADLSRCGFRGDHEVDHIGN